MRISLPSPRTAGPGSTIIPISRMQPRWYRHRPIQPASVTEPVHLTGFGTSDRLYNKLDFHALKTHGHQSLSYTAKTNTVLWRRARICLLINFSFSMANCRHRALLFCDLFIYILPPQSLCQETQMHSEIYADAEKVPSFPLQYSFYFLENRQECSKLL